MKTYAIIFAFLFMGYYGTAQNSHKVKESTFLGSLGDTNQTHISLEIKPMKISKQGEQSLARLYKYKNSRIKKALSFTTPRNKAKLA